MANINELKVFEDNKVKWIFVTDFLCFLRKYLKPTDHLKEIRRDNFLTVFKHFPEAVAVKQKQIAIHFILVIKYIFLKYEHLEVCRTIAKQVESCILKGCQENMGSGQLYKKSNALELDSKGQYHTNKIKSCMCGLYLFVRLSVCLKSGLCICIWFW